MNNLYDLWEKEHKDGIYLGEEKNKIDENVTICYNYNTIYLIGEEYRSLMKRPKLLFTQIDKNTYKIEDIYCIHNNIGNGTLLIKGLERYIKQTNSDKNIKIIGFLSDIDKNHKERQICFYKKNGFSIIENHIKKLL